MDTATIVVIAVVGVLLLLALGGFVANRRRQAATEVQFHARVKQANQDLAAAHAADNGWDPGRLEATARAAFAEREPGHGISSLHLVQVLDPPGTDEDKAVFRVQADGGPRMMTLGRRGQEWVLERLD